VEGIEPDPTTGLHRIRLSNGKTVDTRTVLIATGGKPRKPDFEGADDDRVLVGDSERLKGLIAAGEPVVVQGGANSAAQGALGVARKSGNVTVITRSPLGKRMSQWQQDAIAANPHIKVIEGDEIAAYATKPDGTRVVRTKGGQEIPAAAVGSFLGTEAEVGFAPASVKRTGQNKIVTRNNWVTDAPGIFAAGDIVEGSVPGVQAAAGQGNMAVRGPIWAYLENAARVAEQARQAKVTTMSVRGMQLVDAEAWDDAQAIEQGRRQRPRGGQPLTGPNRWARIEAWKRLLDDADVLDQLLPYFAERGGD
jgi:thioredoxin reductase